MRAAVVSEFGRPPRYGEWAEPVPHSGHERVVEVFAAGRHPRVRSQAGGSHYTSTDELPLVPGIDGVGRGPDGSLLYFVLPDVALGSMAERTLVDSRRSIPLPPDVDVARIAAAMNPAMSSWVALKKRVAFEPGQSVLVLGATGSAGQLAIQVARHLGAGEVIAAGRDRGRLDALGADRAIDLETGDISRAGNVDVVLDYLWGPPAEASIMPLLRGRDDRSRLLSWIQIGAVAGPAVALPSEALRQANVHFLGSGQGSVSAAGILETLPSLVDQVRSFSINVVSEPLADVEAAWAPREGGERVVLVP